MLNVRPSRGSLEQVPPLVSYGGSTPMANNESILLAHNIPTGTRDESLIVGLTSTKAYQLRLNNLSTSPVLTNPDGTAATFTATGGRWAHAFYHGQLYFTNEDNLIRSTDGNYVRDLTGAPSARYLATWFDHLVTGWDTFNGEVGPTRFRISDLYDLSSWTPTQINEADLFDVAEWVLPDFPLMGISGITKKNDLLCVYTTTAIIGVRYVGLPKVIQFAPLVENCGNSFRNGMVSHRGFDFFYDGVEQDFVAFNGATPERIGGPVLDYFHSTLHSDPVIQQKLWATARREFQELWFYYPSAGGAGQVDSAIVFNYSTKEWFISSFSQDAHSFGGQARRAKTIDELTGTIDSKSGTEIRDLSAGGELVPRFFGISAGYVVREAVAADANNTLLSQTTPYLETKDFYGSDPYAVKEIDGVFLQTAYGSTITGVEVFLSARMNLSDTVTFESVGTWTPTLPEGRLTFSAKSGRIFRWKFVPKVTGGQVARDFTWSLYAPAVYATGAEK